VERTHQVPGAPLLHWDLIQELIPQLREERKSLRGSPAPARGAQFEASFGIEVR